MPSDCAALLDALPWGVLVLDEHNVIRRINQQAAKWCGAAPEALLGNLLTQVGLPSALTATLHQLLKSAAAAPHDSWLPHVQQWVSLRLGPAPAGQQWVFWEDATLRHQAETDRQRNVELLLDMEAVAHTGSYEADLTTGSLYFSDGMYRLFGELPRTFVPTPEVIEARSHPDDAAAIQQILAEAIRTRQPYTYRRRICRPDGQWRTLEAHGAVRTNAAGTAGQLRGLVQDVTERVQAEQALHQSHQLLQRTIDSSLDLVQVFQAVRDEQGTVVDFVWVLNNVAAEQVYGSVLGQRLCERNPGVMAEGIFNTFCHVLKTGVPNQTERHYVHEQFDGWFYQSTVKQDDGVTTTTHDISARKRLEQELRESKTLLQDIIDAPHIGLAVYRAVRNEAGDVVDFVHEYINRASRDMLGEDFTGRRFTDHGENGRLQLQQLCHVLDTGQRNSYLREADFRGRPVWFAITNTPLDGERLVHTWEDVTERQQAQQQILQLQQKLAQHVTDKYHALFQSMDQGFAVLEVLFDEAGNQAVDFRYQELNPVFVRESGMPEGAHGRTARELLPDLEPFWFESYGQVARTGEPLRVEHYVPAVGRWFDVHAFRVGSPETHNVAVLFNDITERKRRETTAALLVAISEDLNRLAGEKEMLAAVGAHLTRHLDLNCWYFVDVDEARAEVTLRHFWHAQNVPSIQGTYPIAGFLSPSAVARMRGGAPAVVADGPGMLPSDSETGAVLATGAVAPQIAACIAVPYSLGGQWKAYFAVADSRPRPWTDAETALVQDVAARVFPRIERARAEEALRESEEKYRTLFDSIDEGFALEELVYDANGEIEDIIFRQVNRSYERQGGLTNVVGKSVKEVLPHLEQHWKDVYAQVARTGEPVRLINYAQDVDRWFDTYLTMLAGSNKYIAVVFNDITERKRREQEQEFLLLLSDALRPLTTPGDIQATAAALLGKHLGVDRAYYVDLNYNTQEFIVARDWHRPGAPSHARRYALSNWPMPWLLNGQTWVCRDVDTDPTLPDAQRTDYRGHDIRAAVVVPLLKQGRLAATLVVNQNAPHAWTSQQVALVEETAERTWAAVERAKTEEALRVSEEKYRRIFENIDQGFSLHELVVDESGQVIDVILQEVNAAFEQHTGIKNAQGKKVSEIVPNLAPVWLEAMTRAYNWGETQNFEAYNSDTNRWITSQYSRLGGAGSRLLSTVFTDITERKHREQHQEFLLKLSDVLRPGADSAALERAALQVLGETLGADRVFLATVQADGISWSVREEYTAGLPGATGSYPLLEFQLKRLPQWQAGQMSSVADSETDPSFSAADRATYAAFGLRAAIGVPLVKGGRFTALLCINQATPRRWTAAELALTSEAAERIWVALERARAEEALAASEQRLRALIANLPGAAAFVVGPDLRYQLAGGEALDAASLSPADLLGRTISEAMPPALVPKYEAHYRQALAGQAFSLEHTAHGRTFISRGVPLLGAAGQPEAVLVVSYDITARKQTEEALLASEVQLAELNTQLEQRVARRTQQLQDSRDLLQSVLDTSLISMSVLYAVRDEAGQVQDFRLGLVNKELERETGRTDLVGKLYAQEYPGIRQVGIFDLMLRALATDEPQTLEYFYDYEGFNRWYTCQFVKMGDGLVATNLDITERKAAEQERLKNLRLLEQAEAVAGLGSWDYDLATGHMRWSDGMYHLVNLPQGQPVSPDVYLQLVVKDDRPRAEQLVHQLTSGKNAEQILRLRVGEQIKTVRLKAVVLRNEAGQPERVLGVDLDISELQRLEADNLRLRLVQQQALFEAVQEAQEAERKRIAEGLHNGIDQILYATKLRLDRLHAPALGTDPVLLAVRQEAGQLLAEAIRQTRSLSHELVSLVLEEFGLAALLDICTKMSSPKLHLRSHVDLDEAVAPLSPSLQLALYRIAQELALNTIKHAKGATEATLELETMPGWVLLRIEDNGAGFAVDASKKPGLGLRSIRDRVALLEGQLEIGSPSAGGAYVRIRIPLPLIPAA
ncbi:PAS domain-containing protein [Hymenobacter endophyticus]|uniref:histidine kinase n=1 Tax=Hymenobacter endophyticus TaxID=3076335 RepID=A0ABU3TCM2_9BACT|nr:PAS domain-containing protein [Hymenobacter endophyticus]MDU0369115.1 PAS domain-containing protein [Hymenobacter endophyticus]